MAFLRVVHRGAGTCSTVFMVGLPRSGTTFMEQAIASYSPTYGAAELQPGPRIFRDSANGRGPFRKAN